ncbi:MAG: hypothetical protein ACRDY2_12420 [Acidimicrobiales bacterium]
MNVLSLKLDPTSRGMGFGAATIAAFSFLVLWVPNLHHSSGHATGGTYLAIGLVLAAAILVATLSGRLFALTAAMVFTAVGPWGPERLFQILFALAAAWLVLKLVLSARRAGADSA